MGVPDDMDLDEGTTAQEAAAEGDGDQPDWGCGSESGSLSGNSDHDSDWDASGMNEYNSRHST